MSFIFLVPGLENRQNIDFIKEEFDLDKIILITDKSIPDSSFDETIQIKDDTWEEVFRIVKEKREEYSDKNLIIGPVEGCTDLDLALINAGFVNGLKVLSVKNGKIIMLPMLKFSMYKELTDKKLEIVRLLYENPDYELNLETIGAKTKMSPPLVSYHINGNLKSEGLKELGIVTSRDDHGKSFVKLTKLGIFAVKGYL